MAHFPAFLCFPMLPLLLFTLFYLMSLSVTALELFINIAIIFPLLFMFIYIRTSLRPSFAA